MLLVAAFLFFSYALSIFSAFLTAHSSNASLGKTKWEQSYKPFKPAKTRSE